MTTSFPVGRLSSAKSAVIREGKKRSDDEEDEQFLVAEAAPDPAETADQVADRLAPQRDRLHLLR